MLSLNGLQTIFNFSLDRQNFTDTKSPSIMLEQTLRAASDNFSSTQNSLTENILSLNRSLSEIWLFGMHHSGTSFATALLGLAGVEMITSRNLTEDLKQNQNALDGKNLISTDQIGSHHITYELIEFRKEIDALMRSFRSNWLYICDFEERWKLNRSIPRHQNFITYVKLFERKAREVAAKSIANAFVVKDPRFSFGDADSGGAARKERGNEVKKNISY